MTSARSPAHWDRGPADEPSTVASKQPYRKKSLLLSFPFLSPSDFLLLCMRTKWVVYSDFTAIISHHVWFPIMCQLVVEINSGSAVVVRHPLSRGFLLWKIEERERVRPWRQMLRSRFCKLPRNIFFNSSRVCFTNAAYCYETVVIYQRKSDTIVLLNNIFV